MNRLAAFVGHSFSDKDASIVRTFLDFFNTVANLGIGFTWDHAEVAEPKELPAKVKAKMEGKNLFIGICTAKEYGVDPEHLTSPLLRKDWLQGQKQRFAVKTSDWVTQEIGYAIGRGMDVILLLEEGVRRPGGLQGDLEYIPFNRTSASECFSKFMEMINALSPKPLVKSEPNAATPPSASEESKSEKAEGGPTSDPQPTWAKVDYERAIFNAIFDKQNERAASIREHFARTEAGKDAVEVDELEAQAIAFESVLHGTDNTARLQELAKLHPNDGRFATYLGRAFERYGMHDKAAEQYILAGRASSDIAEKTGSFAEAALEKARAGDANAESWLRQQINAMGTAAGRARRSYLWGLSQIADLSGSQDLWLAYEEARIQERPDDHDSRFNLAYKYSAQNNERLALYHYLRIPVGKRENWAWNNIGASSESLDLKISAVAAYQKSKELGGTRAVSNLAYSLINAGFVNEAEALCKEALKSPDYDRRVATALGSIDEETRKQEEREKAILTAAEKEHAFMGAFGIALADTGLPDSTSTWNAPECEVAVTIQDGRFRATGKFTRQVGGLASMMLLGSSSGREPRRKTMVVVYEGNIRGRGCIVDKTVHEEGETPPLLGSSSEKSYLIIEEGLATIKELRPKEKQDAEFREWRRSSA